MNTKGHGMRMLSDYTSMNAEELTYEGGFFWVVPCAAISAICTGISAVATIASVCGYKNDTLTKLGRVVAVVGTATGVASGVGTLWTATASTSARALAAATSSLTLEPGMTVATYPL